MKVIIDGVSYYPCVGERYPIGIAITTHNRADVLKSSLEQHMTHLPAGALVVVIDDGLKPAAIAPDGVQLLRHDKSLGIVASKNASLSTLTDDGCEHLSLGDDDTWQSPLPALMLWPFDNGIIRLYYRSQSYRFWKKE